MITYQFKTDKDSGLNYSLLSCVLLCTIHYRPMTLAHKTKKIKLNNLFIVYNHIYYIRRMRRLPNIDLNRFKHKHQFR